MKRYLHDLAVFAIFTVGLCFVTTLVVVICAQQHYLEAVAFVSKGDGTDESIERGMWNYGFNIDAMNPNPPKLSAKVRALFYDLPCEDAPNDQEYIDDLRSEYLESIKGWWNPAVNEFRTFYCIKRNADVWYLSLDNICDSCAVEIWQDEEHMEDEYYDRFTF